MEKGTIIDFGAIKDLSDFYSVLHQKVTLPDFFGDNLDALYDWISGDLDLPFTMVLINLDFTNISRFASLISTLEELSEDLDGFKLYLFS